MIKSDGDAPSRSAGKGYEALAKIVLGGQPLGAVLTRLAQVAADLVPSIDEVSITLIEGDRPRSVAFSGQRAIALDERQYEAGYGPCTDAAVTGSIITIEDTRHETVYPEFARQAVRVGITHTHSIGLPTVLEGRTGAMNMYGTAGALDQDSRDLAAEFASYAAVAVANASVYAGALQEVEQMRTAMASRAVIEQAKGIIMAGRHCTADQAFNLLRDASSRSNRKLRDIAQALVDGTIT